MFKTKHLSLFALVIALLLGASPLTAHAQEDPSMAQECLTQEGAEAFAQRFDAIFDGPSLEIVDELFASDFVSHLPLAPELDRQGLKDYIASFYEGLSDLTEEVNAVIVGEDRVVLSVSYMGTHDGPVFGIPATGNPIEMHGIGIFRFDENCQVAENTAVIDVVGLLAQIGAFPPAQTSDTVLSDSHRAALLRFMEEGINSGNFDLIEEMFAPEYVAHTPGGDLDREGARAFLSALRAALTDFDMTASSVIVEGDHAAAHLTTTGVFDQALQTANGPIPPNGQPINLESVNLFRFNEDGLLVEEWVQFDNLGFLTQLGAIPPAGGGEQPASSQQPGDTESVIRAFYEAANAGDWETALSYWADDGTFTVMGQVMQGKEQIRAFMAAAREEHGFVEVTQLEATGDSATWVSLPEAGGEFHLSATLKDGKIQTMTIE